MAAALFAARAGARLAPAAGAALPAARWEPSNARGMASLSDVKQRMKSVANIVKITKAMKMVAAARLRSAQTNVIESRGMREGMHRMMGDLPSGEGVETLVSVPMTSDRGLCGGINSNINKYTKQISGLNEAEKTSYVDGTKGAPGFSFSSLVAEEILEQDADAARVVYNRFKSAITFEPTLATVQGAKALEEGPFGTAIEAYEIEGPAKSEVLADLSEFNLAVTVHNGFLENSCSEQASRVQAMENSSKNGGEMLDALTLLYNRPRQAAITTELTEIISGAAAIEG